MKIKDFIMEQDFQPLTLSYEEEEETKSVTYSDNDIRFMFLTNFASWEVMNILPFNQLWSEFIRLQKTQYERMARAMLIDYNPIENYNGIETTTTTKTGHDSITMTGSEKDSMNGIESDKFIGGESTTFTGKQNTKNDNLTNTHSVTGYNSNDMQPESKDVATGQTEVSFENRKDTTSYSSDRENKHEFTNRYNEKTFTNRKNQTDYNTIDKLNMHRHGNLGVTKSQEMALDEVSMRQFKNNILLQIVYDFVNRFCYL